MPAALEKKLKHEASEKGLSKDRKDAYVYGTLRKTGWKPSTQKKMSSPDTRMIRLAKIDNHLDSLIRFDYGDDQNKKSLVGTVGKATAATGAVAGAGVGGALLQQAVQKSGGYGANWAAGKSAFGRSLANPAKGMQGLTKGPGRAIGQQLGGALAKLKSVLPSFEIAASAKGGPEIHFDEHILEPASGGQWGQVPKSKIFQEEFPAGLSPAAALKFPLPKLMRYLNRPQQLQQQFKGFSKKHERLIQLSSKLDEITK